MRLDLLPVRPDIFDAGGLARALRGYMGVDTGLADYAVADPSWRVEVDPRIIDPKFRRPLIQCAIIRNLLIDDNVLRAIMRLQENLHWALCRDRKFASIGAYDLDALENPISYTLVDRHDFRFSPLFWGQREPVSPETMLTEHPKGIDYAHLVEGMELLPALLSANGNVLSLPPIINAEETKLTTATRNVLVDVTGHNQRVVEKALAILATSLVELDPRGEASLERVAMVFPDRTAATPELAPEAFTVDPAYVRKWLGIEIDRADCVELLGKMRHGVRDSGGNAPLQVQVPAYRCDIMHEVDLIEDIAIAYGYHNIEPKLVPTFTAGRGLPLNDRSRQAAAALTGLGFTECLSLVLTSERHHYEKMLRETASRRVTLANPISQDQTMMRENLYSSLLGTPGDEHRPSAAATHLRGRRRAELRRCIRGSAATARAARDRRSVLRHTGGLRDGRSALDALLHEMGLGKNGTVEYRADDNPSALHGRSAVVYLQEDGGERRIAEVFEVHPQVLENWRLGNPVVLFSLTLGEVEYY